MTYSAKLLDRELLAGDVAVFRIEKPDGFTFKAGQWCAVTVPDIGFHDERGLKRPLSIASSPREKDLLFATKLSNSAMKRTMAEIKTGTIISLDEPLGSLLLPEDVTVPLVFLAGGIGITPFRSMLQYAAETPTGHTITLFYSNRTPEETPFLEDLARLSRESGAIRVYNTMTRVGVGSNWSGLTGRLNPQMVMDNCRSWESAAYYIVGPPAMADAMKQTLSDMKIDPKRITVELFAGY